MAVALSAALDPRTYRRIAYLLNAFPLGSAYFVFLVTVLSAGLGLAITLLGIPVLVAALYAWRVLAEFERWLIAHLLDVEIPAPYRPDPPGSVWTRLRSRLADPATWKDLVFLLLHFPFGVLAFSAVVALLGASLGVLASPLLEIWVPDYDIGPIDTFAETLPLIPIGAVLLVGSLHALRWAGGIYGYFATLLLGSNADPRLTAQVSELRSARARVIAAADAERRRLERDLHDGAQQRLVSLAMTLGMAKRRMEDADDQTKLLLDQADEEAKMALEELRDLARGLHPAILSSRGLGPALDDLASRATLPVRVGSRPSERLPEPVEAAVYFVVSESLTNVAKHAQANEATVRVELEDDQAMVEVRDDGAGGADLEGGSGLQGLLDRVTALEGTLEVESSPGEGTSVRARIPRTGYQEAASEEVPVAGGRALHQVLIFDDDEARVRRAARRRDQAVHAAGLLGVGLVLIAIWAPTGSGYFWPVWPLIGIAALLLAVAWAAFGEREITESDVRAGRGPPEAAVQRLQRRRVFKRQVATFATLNLALIAVWAAAGFGHFWPHWSITGSLSIIGISAFAMFGPGHRQAARRSVPEADQAS